MAITITGLSRHPGLWLRADAAASMERFENDHGTFDINSAGRSRASQQALVDRWNRGGAANRPPYLYKPAAVGTSPHEQGTAVDSDTPMRLANQPSYGWYRNLPTSDPVHLVYDPARDQHRSRPSGGSGTPIDGDNDMPLTEDDIYRIWTFRLTNTRGASKRAADFLSDNAEDTWNLPITYSGQTHGMHTWILGMSDNVEATRQAVLNVERLVKEIPTTPATGGTGGTTNIAPILEALTALKAQVAAIKVPTALENGAAARNAIVK